MAPKTAIMYLDSFMKRNQADLKLVWYKSNIDHSNITICRLLILQILQTVVDCKDTEMPFTVFLHVARNKNFQKVNMGRPIMSTLSTTRGCKVAALQD